MSWSPSMQEIQDNVVEYLELLLTQGLVRRGYMPFSGTEILSYATRNSKAIKNVIKCAIDDHCIGRDDYNFCRRLYDLVSQINLTGHKRLTPQQKEMLLERYEFTNYSGVTCGPLYLRN